MFRANIVPGQGFIKLTVVKIKHKNVDGRIMNTEEKQDKVFFGMVTSASQREVEHWKQLGHPITNIIVSSDAVIKADATDYLVSDDGRRFYVQGCDNPAGLNIAMAYYVEERFDK